MSVQLRATFLIFLFLGHEFIILATRVEEVTDSKGEAACPVIDSGCSLVSYTSTDCKPANCCIYESGISNMLNPCQLDYPHRPDTRLIKEFVKKTRTLLRGLDRFRHKGGLFDLWDSGAMKAMARVMQIAKATESGNQKFTKKAVDLFFTFEGVEGFKFELDYLKEDSGYDFEVFSVGPVDIPFEFKDTEAPSDAGATPAQWVFLSLRKGIAKTLEDPKYGFFKDRLKQMLQVLQNDDVSNKTSVDHVLQSLAPGRSADEVVSEVIEELENPSAETKSSLDEGNAKLSALLELGEGGSQLVQTREPATLVFVLFLIGIFAFCSCYYMSTARTRMQVTGRQTSAGSYGRAKVTNTDMFGTDVFKFKWDSRRK